MVGRFGELGSGQGVIAQMEIELAKQLDGRDIVVVLCNYHSEYAMITVQSRMTQSGHASQHA